MTDLPGAKVELNLDELFREDPDTGTPPVNDEQKLELTKAMSKRINEVRSQTEASVRDNIAKELGYANYEEFEKAKDKKLITEAGYNPEEIEKIIEPLLEKRLATDPRMLKLKSIEEQEEKNYMSSQLAEIEKLTGLKITEADLDEDTKNLWQKGIDLSKAFIAANPTKVIQRSSVGSTAHLATGSGAGKVKLRTMTEDEKAFYKAVNPFASDEEINKKTIEVK